MNDGNVDHSFSVIRLGWTWCQ